MGHPDGNWDAPQRVLNVKFSVFCCLCCLAIDHCLYRSSPHLMLCCTVFSVTWLRFSCPGSSAASELRKMVNEMACPRGVAVVVCPLQWRWGGYVPNKCMWTLRSLRCYTMPRYQHVGVGGAYSCKWLRCEWREWVVGVHRLWESRVLRQEGEGCGSRLACPCGSLSITLDL